MAVVKTIVKDRVFQITAIIAILSCFLARPRLADINFTTLWSLLAMMTTIQIFEHLHVLDFLAYKMSSRAHNARHLTALFVMLSFFSAMFLTNDMAVLTFIPLYLRIAKKFDLPEILPVTAITIGANQGSAMTPFGNAHNIFLMSEFKIPVTTFFTWVIPLFLIAALVLIVLVMLVPKKELPMPPAEDIRIMMRPTVITVIVALVVFASIFNVLPAWVAALIAVIWACLVDWHIMGKVDYAIVLTFAGFFLIISNINQIPAVSNLLSAIIHTPLSVYLTSVILSQFISNVPTTVLVSNFTTHLPAIFYGTNIGGLGTLVASMCNLVAFKQYTLYSKKSHRRFLTYFMMINFVALLVIGAVGLCAAIYFE